jgi:hypothetical protein
MSDIPEEPKKSAADVAYTVAKAAVSAVPVAGGPAAEVLGLIFGPPLEKRREKWLEQLADAVKEVQEKVAELTPEKLSQNEAFITTALHATEIAVRTHQQEKLGALRNAVVSAALPGAPDETMQQIFLNHVDNLTPWHLRILAFFDNPQDWARRHKITYPTWTMGSPGLVLEQSMPELAGRRGLYDQIASDLEQRGLMPGGGLHTMMTAHGMFSPRTTPLGKQFLQFISRK